jgi:hypothetical protein
MFQKLRICQIPHDIEDYFSYTLRIVRLVTNVLFNIPRQVYTTHLLTRWWF